jgi:hypothetical protein
MVYVCLALFYGKNEREACGGAALGGDPVLGRKHLSWEREDPVPGEAGTVQKDLFHL